MYTLIIIIRNFILYHIAVISTLYFHLFVQIKSSSFPWRKNKINILLLCLSFCIYPSFLFHSFSFTLDRYVCQSRRVCRSWLQKRHVAECLRPITIRGESFARTHGTFSFNIAFCSLRLLQNSSYKVCLCRERPAIRAADTFICSATNTNHLYKAHIYLTRGRWPFCTRGHRHTRPFSARFSDTTCISHVSLHLQSHHCPEVQSHETIFILICRSLA